MAKTIKELTQDLLQAPSACKEVKEAAQNYLDAAGTEKEADAATAYVKELEADIMPIDGLISFAGSDMGAQVFGAENAKKKRNSSRPQQLLIFPKSRGRSSRIKLHQSTETADRDNREWKYV